MAEENCSSDRGGWGEEEACIKCLPTEFLAMITKLRIISTRENKWVNPKRYEVPADHKGAR